MLVELFNKRNFVCDCGTTRLPSTSPCRLRLNSVSNLKGGLASEPAEPNNKYNQNFRNRFCGCECDYDPHQQKGTMFQCLGLGTVEEGGCGEDWYHPGCIVGLGPNWYENQPPTKKAYIGNALETIMEVSSAVVEGHEHETDNHVEDDNDDVPPPGFPNEDEFEGFICYKCVNANPWIKRYASTKGFLEPVFKRSTAPSPETETETELDKMGLADSKTANGVIASPMMSKKRKSEDSGSADTAPSKRVRKNDIDLTNESITGETTETLDIDNLASDAALNTIISNVDSDSSGTSAEGQSNAKHIASDTTGPPDGLASEATPAKACKYDVLPPAPKGDISLFFKPGFRDYLCHCSSCFPWLTSHPQLIDEEDTYEPPVSTDGGSNADGSTHGSGGSLLDRGERALTNVDRVRAIEGVMAFNHLREKLKPFFKEFAENGKAISAEDIKAHFAKIRGDEEAIRQAAAGATGTGDYRREQRGY
jgi:E3 ubiquitin-protein ligase UBR7